jgi:hypothetical protein
MGGRNAGSRHNLELKGDAGLTALVYECVAVAFKSHLASRTRRRTVTRENDISPFAFSSSVPSQTSLAMLRLFSHPFS